MKKTTSVPVLLVTVLLFILAVNTFGTEEIKKINIQVEISNLKSENMGKKLSAISKLGKVKDEKATEALMKELKKEKNPYIKSKIVESLAYSEDKDVVKEVVGILKTDPSAEVRFSAAYSLGYMNDVSVVPVLIETFLNEKEVLGVRLQAANSLTFYSPTDEVYQCFLKGIENENLHIKHQAIVSLSIIFMSEKEKVVPILKKLLNDKEKKTRDIAKERLEFLNVKHDE